MCSVQEGDLDVPVARPKLASDEKSKICMKCGEQQAIVVIRVGDPFCRDCFMQYAVHKFRSAFGKNKVVGYKENVLMAFSGGASSNAMLHLVKEGNSEKAFKKLGFNVGLVFINESVVSGQTLAEKEVFRDEVLSVMNKSEYPCYYSSLELALHVGKTTVKRPTTHDQPIPNSDGSSIDSGFLLQSSQDGKETLESYTDLVDNLRLSQMSLYDSAEKDFLERLKSFKSLTAKEEFVHLLRHQLLLDIARKNGYTKIMLGDSSTRLAAAILANISQGRGAHVALDTGFLDSRLPDVMFIRPMRDFTTKEIAMYNILNDIHPVVAPNLSTKMPMNASIYRLTENFVNGLQNDFPATVSTIFRTGSKMQAARSSDSNKKSNGPQVTEARSEAPEYSDDCCPFCMAPLDTRVTESSALYATQFSESLSQRADVVQDSGGCGSNQECCGKGDGSCNTVADVLLTKAQVMSYLCYGCQLVVRDMNDPVRYLPDFVLKNISWRIRRSTMRDQISDFLLPEDD
ncbi:cytoplasmic tRNA 2-thiolation protein 2-A-like [Lineus longissimus]|uniref:cytoplasmic tRNA 2-thiolation protein 2-A-like n=1 Tax=Lineus longissimus TaxID=88925 RepID=UPI00315DC07A